ncbi:MAG TPA: SDR family oxidoreductase, partial [Aggregatilineales bacterium]|nr:SDR family oxidoreductase [Aggregatilineales bacterium]
RFSVPEDYLAQLFSLEGKVVIITGGMGVIASAMTKALANVGARVGILDLSSRRAEAEARAARMEADGHPALALSGSVLDRQDLLNVREVVLARWGRIDILINTAGGNKPGAIVSPDKSFFTDLSREAIEDVFDLNLMGTILPCQVFGETMAAQKEGCIINISSMAAIRTLTQVVGYSAAKAGIDNFTRWLAVEMARKYGAGLRVNAIAPGFFVGEQNRRLLLNEDNTLTDRGQSIIQHTPAGRFGEPEELLSTLIWLCGPGAAFVNGVVVPVDGGFSVFSGV